MEQPPRNRINNELWHNIVARSSNHCCRGNTTMRSVCTVEINVAAHSIKISNVAPKLLLR